MSRIATALSLSRGSFSQFPSTAEPRIVEQSDAAPVAPTPRLSKRLLIIATGGAIGAFVLAGLLLWMLLRQEEPVDAPNWVHRARRAVPQVKSPPVTAEVVAAPEPLEAIPAPVSLPSEEIAEAVQQLAITAVTSGAVPKAYIAGKVFVLDDLVAPGIHLDEIKDGVLIFRDEAGHRYPRRF